MSIHIQIIFAAILILAPTFVPAQEADTLRQSPSKNQSGYKVPVGSSHVVSTDSLLRWQQWSGFAEWASRRPDLSVYELGGYGRSAAILTGFGMPNADRIRWNGVMLNSPLSGQFHPLNIPIDQSAVVAQNRYGMSLWYITPLVYAVSQPRTVIRYEQSSFEYRNLDGILAMPVTGQIAVQASYQGQKDNGKYSRSNFEGRRTTGNIRYSGNRGTVTDVFWFYQGAELQESLGFQFTDPSSFSFDRFRAQPRSSNTASMRRFLLAGVRWSPGSEVHGRDITVYRKLQRNDWRTSDTTGVRSAEWGLSAQYEINAARGVRLQPYADIAFVGKENGDADILAGSKLAGAAGARAAMKLGPHIEIVVNGELNRALQGGGGFIDTGVNIRLPMQSTLRVGQSVSRNVRPALLDAAPLFGMLPTDIPAHAYEQVFYVAVNRAEGLWRYDVQMKASTGGVVSALSNGGQIVPLDMGGSVRTSAWVERHGSGSELAVGHQLIRWGDVGSLGGASVEQRMLAQAFAKGYAFDRAAYFKGGAVFSAALNEFRGMAYVPQLDMWLHDATGARVPAYHRLDLELSARVRSMILMVRLENTLDGWTQKGYFQTLPYPMPGRRLRFGLNVHFRD